MNRYLLNISYIGTNFRGIQRTLNKLLETPPDTTTVQGCIELALRVFRPVNKIQTVLSSRTDAGVHALHSTLHVDLQRYDSQPYDATVLTGVLNRTLHKQSLPIRVLSIQHVPETFHCRYNAQARTYLYRLAVAKKNVGEPCQQTNRAFEVFLPVEEYDRCYFMQNADFDIERCRAGARMFIGRHDFRTFMSTSRDKSGNRDHPMFTLRRIEKFNIHPAKSLAIGVNALKAEELYNFWDIEIKGKSFVYKQVRRMVGSLIALATGVIDEKCIYEMLTIPSKNSWHPRILLAPAFGLYLNQVHYKDQDFTAQS